MTPLCASQVCDQTGENREGRCYLTLAPRPAPHNPTDVFSSSSWSSWWNICSVVKGFIVALIVASLSNISICPLYGTIHLSCVTVRVCVCVSTGCGVNAFITKFFKLVWQDRSFLSLCPFSEMLNNDPHNSLHAPLTEENKTALLA